MAGMDVVHAMLFHCIRHISYLVVNSQECHHKNFLTCKKDKSMSMKTCPVAAENNKDNLLLEKNDFFTFQGTVATFCRLGGRKRKC